MDLGKAIKTLRTQRGITQSELAEAISLSKTYLSLIEKGHRKPSLEALEGITRALNLPMASLFVAAIEEEDLPENTRPMLKKYKPLMGQMLSVLYDDTQAKMLNLINTISER